jgi:hypothetical protein
LKVAVSKLAASEKSRADTVLMLAEGSGEFRTAICASAVGRKPAAKARFNKNKAILIKS